jgi:ABC-type Fe3+ transport system permease subunit
LLAVCCGPLFSGLICFALEPSAKQTANAFLAIGVKTIGLTGLAGALAVAIGWLLAGALHGLGSRGVRTLALSCFMLPWFLPQYITALAWSLLLDGSGWAGSTGIHALPWLLQSEIGKAGLVTLVFTISALPLTTLGGFVAQCMHDTTAVEAGLLHLTRANRWKLAWLRDWHYFSAMALFISLYLASDFAVPDLFQVRLISTEIFAAAALGEGQIYQDLARWLLFFLLLCGLYAFTLLNPLRDQGLALHGRTATPLRHGAIWLKVAPLTLIILAGMVVVLPILNLASIAQTGQVMVQILHSLWPSLIGSLVISVAAALLASLIGILLALYIEQGRRRTGIILRASLWAMLFTPSAMIAMAFQAGLSNVTHWLNNDALIAVTVFALSAKWCAISVEICLLSFRAIVTSSRDAAALFLSSWYQATWRITLAGAYKPIVFSALAVALLAINDLSISVLTMPPGWSTLSTHLYSYVHYGPESHIATVSILHITFIFVPAIACAALLATAVTALSTPDHGGAHAKP